MLHDSEKKKVELKGIQGHQKPNLIARGRTKFTTSGAHDVIATVSEPCSDNPSVREPHTHST